MIGCPDCYKSISETAEVCPGCGCNISAEIIAKQKAEIKAAEKVIWAIGIGFFGGVLSLFLLSTGSRGESANTRIAVERTKSSDKWWESGTLNSASVSEWKSASRQNKLATAADWLSCTAWKGKLNTLSDFDKLKTKAEKLANAIDGSVADVAAGRWTMSTKVNEIAAFFVAYANDLGP